MCRSRRVSVIPPPPGAGRPHPADGGDSTPRTGPPPTVPRGAAGPQPGADQHRLTSRSSPLRRGADRSSTRAAAARRNPSFPASDRRRGRSQHDDDRWSRHAEALAGDRGRSRHDDGRHGPPFCSPASLRRSPLLAPRFTARPAVPGRVGLAADDAPRRLADGVLVGALTMLAVATLDTFAGATVPVLGTFAALPGPTGQEVVEVPAPPSQPGTCLNWTRPDAADAAAVDCGQAHLFEQAGSVRSPTSPRCPTTSSGASWSRSAATRSSPATSRASSTPTAGTASGR